MKKTKLAMFTIFSALLIALLSACAGTAAVPQPAAQPEIAAQAEPEFHYEEDEAEEATEASPEATEAANFPLEIVTFNFEGNEITTVYNEVPTRVVAVYQGAIETMIALGLENHVVGSWGLDNEIRADWQAALDLMNYDDSVFAPERETVIMLEPDLIFSWGSLFGQILGDVYYWIDSGTNTYINTNTRRGGGHPRTVENEFTDILNIGRIFNVEYRAQAIVDEMQSEIDSTLAIAQGLETQRVSIVEFRGDGGITNYPYTQLGGNMVYRLGGELAIPEIAQIGIEDLLAADPDVIFVVYMQRYGPDGEDATAASIAQVMENPALSTLNAVQRARVHAIMLGDMFASAVRTLDGIQTFAAGMFPES